MKWRWISKHATLSAAFTFLVAGGLSLERGVIVSSAQGQPAKRDWDGVLEQDEVPDPRIDYTRPRTMPTIATDASRGLSACSRRGVRGIPAPRVEIEDRRRTEQKSGSTLFVQGFVEGECLATAGLYVDGVLKESFTVHTQPAAKRFPFSVALQLGTRGEIRVYTVTHHVTVAEVR
jgi:hypothetical protein